MDRYALAFLLFFYAIVITFGLRQELINEELKQQNALQRAEIEELQKKTRLTAQDVGFLEQLVIEGKQ